jgi:peptide/nickel transport system permease protein
VAFLVAVALLAPILAPHDPTHGDLRGLRPGVVPGPSLEHPLGLDQQGRDELSRIVYGARYSLAVGVLSVALATLGGIVIGTMAGMVGGWIDALLMRVTDVLLAIPGLLFAIGLVALLGPSLWSVTLALAVNGIPFVARLLRGTVLAEREREYILAARAAGASTWRIALRHVLPNSLSPVIVGATLGVGGAMLGAAGLSFLGLGPSDPSVPEWGRMLAESQGLLESAPHLALFPGAAIVLAVLAFTLLGEALRVELDPKLRAPTAG